MSEQDKKNEGKKRDGIRETIDRIPWWAFPLIGIGLATLLFGSPS